MKKTAIVFLAVLTIVALVGAFVWIPSKRIRPDDGGHLALAAPGLETIVAKGVASMPIGQLQVHPYNYAATLEIGSEIEFVVERDGHRLRYKDVTFEIVGGRDCATVYFEGTIRGLGEGVVTVKVFLDNDPSVYGYGSIRVVQPRAANHWTQTKRDVSGAAADAAFEASIAGFPASYRPYLRDLHARYPQWVFRPFQTGVDFFDAVANESAYDDNVILLANYADLIKRKQSNDYDRETREYVMKDTGWVSVNEIAVSHFMDPRNYLDEQGIFQFELLTYDESFHTIEGVEGVLRGTFMHEADISYYDAAGLLVPSDKLYSQVIMEAAQVAGVNPYYLAAKIKLEIGASPSRAATGKCPGYEGLYNFYNIGATDGEGNVERGLAWAGEPSGYGRPWTSPERSIKGGAAFLASGYIDAGQFTCYLQKFNVNPDADYDLYRHQYLTNVSGAAAQGIAVFDGYSEMEILNSPIVFSIPVFENMSAADTEKATSLSVAGTTAGTVSHAVILREGPAAFYSAVDDFQLRAGEFVTVLRSVPTNAAFYRSWLLFPTWYEIAVTRDGATYTGYVSEEFVRRGAQTVLAMDETVTLSPILGQPADTVRYLSENTAVATVSPDGVITAQGSGIAVIVAYTAGGTFDCYTVLVE